MAFTVSLVSLLTLEFYVKRLQWKDLKIQFETLTNKVWEGIAQRLLGDKISEQIDQIMKLDAVKSECHYTITFKELRKHNDEEWVVVVVENSYKLRNSTVFSDRKFTVGASLFGFAEIDDCPKFLELKVDTEPVSLEALKANEKKSFEHSIGLPGDPNKFITVSMSMRLAYHLTGFETFVTDKAAIEQLTIAVNNQLPEILGKFRVDPLHMHSDALEELSLGVSWRSRRAFLPGQAFQLSWARNEKTALSPQEAAPKKKG